MIYARQFLLDDNKKLMAGSKLKNFLHNVANQTIRPIRSPKVQNANSFDTNPVSGLLQKKAKGHSSLAPTRRPLLSSTLRAGPWNALMQKARPREMKGSGPNSANVSIQAQGPKRPKSGGVGAARLKHIYAETNGRGQNKVLVTLLK